MGKKKGSFVEKLVSLFFNSMTQAGLVSYSKELQGVTNSSGRLNHKTLPDIHSADGHAAAAAYHQSFPLVTWR